MNIPINGRIAIIDDKIEQALPLMNVLARRRYACQYFSADRRYLPEEGQEPNDIRILFLDINLLDDAIHPAKQLRGILVTVLRRVISAANFPWVLIYWSRHEEEHGALVKDIFDHDLHDRKPIVYLSQNKSDYFSMDGDLIGDTKINELFGLITERLLEQPAYRQLIAWENLLHRAADKTLQDIFHALHLHSNWTDNAGFLLERLGESFAGKIAFRGQSAEEKIRSAFQTLNNVYADTLEYAVSNTGISRPAELSYDPGFASRENIYKINKKLLLSTDTERVDYSGMVIQDTDPDRDKVYKELLNSSFGREKVKKEAPEGATQKEIDKMASERREAIRASWRKIHVVVTPLCDVVQGKAVNSRVIHGFLVREDLKGYIEDRSEAIFVSPKFDIGGTVYALVLNLRYFYTTHFDPKTLQEQGLTPLFRVRQSLLSEIQSKLARHISRQGVLFIDEV